MREIQIIGEDYVAQLLQERGFTILNRNIVKWPFEFDIICTRKYLQYVIEVRSSTSRNCSVIDLFPATKLLTLLKGRARHYPKAVFMCGKVTITNTMIQVRFYHAEDLL